MLTTDTELGPLNPRWRQEGLDRDIERDLYGRTKSGEVGILYQLDLLNSLQLKSVVFLEPFFTEVAGKGPLSTLVSQIQERGHEIQLHPHTEWLELMPDNPVMGRTGRFIHQFSEADQVTLLRKGLEILTACGATNVIAFRAGGFGANANTLRALATVGLRFDSSYNACYLPNLCQLTRPDLLLQPTTWNGVYEYPISFFSDYPGHYRHAQICACSFLELKRSLMNAWRQNWRSFVIVSHSFELLRQRRRNATQGNETAVDAVVQKRFVKLCHFLAENRDKFRTVGFADIEPSTDCIVDRVSPLRSRVYLTGFRLLEQARRRLP